MHGHSIEPHRRGGSYADPQSMFFKQKLQNTLKINFFFSFSKPKTACMCFRNGGLSLMHARNVCCMNRVSQFRKNVIVVVVVFFSTTLYVFLLPSLFLPMRIYRSDLFTILRLWVLGTHWIQYQWVQLPLYESKALFFIANLLKSLHPGTHQNKNFASQRPNYE